MSYKASPFDKFFTCRTTGGDEVSHLISNVTYTMFKSDILHIGLYINGEEYTVTTTDWPSAKDFVDEVLNFVEQPY